MNFKATIILFFVVLISSCSIEKRVYNKGYYIDWKNSKNKLVLSKSNDEKNHTSNYKTDSIFKTHHVLVSNFESENKNEIKGLYKEKIEIKNQVNCDVILLKNGEEISAKVIEIGVYELKYKKCDNIDGPTFSILKKDVFMIKYPNGNRDVFKDDVGEKKNTVGQENEDIKTESKSDFQKELNGLALTSFLFGILGFIPILGIIFGIIGLNQIKSNPRKYSGEGFAIGGIILSVIWIFVLLLIFL
jgi:hypothetical protein